MACILVVEDDRIQRLVATQALRGAGHEVIDAIDGITGLQAARAERPDLIVCDVLMPNMNGYQFLSALREEEGISAIPVIMLTSMAERSQMRAGMTAGADDYIVKPFSFEELNEAVDAQLDKRRKLQQRLISSVNSSIEGALEDALEGQRESLAARYEEKLVREIGTLWDERTQAEGEVRYEHAVVLKVQLAASLREPWASLKGAAAQIRSTHESIRDNLLLFNAVHLLPAGNDAVAIYVDEADSVRVRATVRAVKAATALLPTLARLRGTSDASPAAHIALHCGPVTVLRMSDPLHGADTMLAIGAAMHELDAIADFARSAQWGIAASPLFVAEMARRQLATGRSAEAPAAAGGGPLDVIEVLSLRDDT